LTATGSGKKYSGRPVPAGKIYGAIACEDREFFCCDRIPEKIPLWLRFGSSEIIHSGTVWNF
jgi:hypothetical protein